MTPRFPRRPALRLADSDQWLYRRLRARARRRGDDGFVLLESVVSISLVMIMTAALAALFISTSQAVNHLRVRQVAVQLADTGIERVRAYEPDALQTNRDPDAVEDQYRDGLAGPAGGDKLTNALQTIADPYPASGSGKTAARPAVPASCPAASTPAYLPTSAQCQAIGSRPFLVNYYLGNCYVKTHGTSCDAAKPTDDTYLSYLRAIIAVTWANDHCTNSSCLYVTSTLIDDNPDPRFSVKYPGVQSPLITAADRINNVGDSGPYDPPTLQSGSGVAPFTWAATNLPPGLSMATDGTITGTIKPQAVGTMVYTVTVNVVDGLIQRMFTTFKWTVRQPTITSPGNQSTVVNTAVNLPVVATCWKPTCTYALSGGPSWLSINAATGVLTGTPNAVGTTSDITVSVTDGNGIKATSDPFDWVVVPTPAAVCVTEIALTNGSFEAPALNTSVPVNTFNYVTTGAPNWMRGGDFPLQWNTTEPDGIVELWHNGFNVQSANGGLPISAEDGSTWAELNANQTGALYQDLATDPGVVLQWSVWHRGRYSSLANASKKDVMQVQIGSTTSQTPQIPTGQTTTAISDGPDAWVLYRGFYVVPPGQTTTRFQFAAISTASGNDSIGNFIDNLSLNNKVACVEKLPDPQTSTVGTPIAGLQLSAIRGSGNYAWGGGNTLPAGLSMNSSGLITGTPTTVGTKSVVLTLTDTQTTYSTNVPFTWTVVPKPTITAPPTQTTSVGGSVNLSLTSSCLNRPCTYTMNTGPAGLTVNSAGVISGTVTSAAQNFNNVTVTVQDKAGVQATTNQFVWKVVNGPTVVNPGNQKTLRGAAVTLSVSASGGIGALSYSATGLPSWLTLNPSTGLITGVAPASSDSTTTGITITVTDGQNAKSTTAPFNWTVYSAPTVTAPANQAGTIGSTVNVSVPASTCPNSPCTFTISGQPTGLTINNSGVITGTIGGTPTTYPNVRVTITDAGGASARSGAFTWTTSYAPLQATTPLAQMSTINTAITPLQLSASGASGSYAWTGSLPAGLSMTSGGRITGTPTALTTGAVTLTVTDTVTLDTMNITFNWAVVAKPTITPPLNQTTTIGAAINLPLTSSCPNAPCSYTLNSGPPGLTINSSGVVTGTVGSLVPTTYNVSVRITDAAGAFATSAPTFTWTVLAKPSITALVAQKTTVGATVNVPVPVPTCPNAPCTLALTNGPPGLNIVGGSVTGTVGGSAQTYNNVKITVTDFAGVSVSSPAFTWTVNPPPTINAPANQTTTVGALISLQLTSTCATTPCSYTLNNGPTGLSISSTGLVTGTVTSSAQTFSNATVTITDAAGVSASTAVFSWLVNPKPTVTAPATQVNTVGGTVSLQLVSTCPNASCSYTLNNGPAGLSINSAGLITGTVTSSAQTFSNASVTITDAAGVVANSTTFTWTVNSAPAIGNPGNQSARGGTADSLNMSTQVAGGTSPYTYSATGLPAWLSINASTGVISGTAPTTRSLTSGITVTVTDDDGITATSPSFQWFVNYPSIAIPNQLTKVSTAASIDLDNYTTAGTAPYTYVITNKPSWLTYTTGTHVLAGTAPSTASTTSNITIAVTDADGTVVTSAVFNWRVVASSGITWSTIAAKSSVPNSAIASVNVAASVSGATAGTFTAVGLPPGLTISAAGLITGTPTLPGVYRVTVSANNSLGQAVPSTPFVWQVTSMTLATIGTQTTPRNAADSFDASSIVSGGVGPLTYSAAALPAWLSINATTGLISGTAPSTISTKSGITVTVTDLTGFVLTTASFSWSVT